MSMRKIFILGTNMVKRRLIMLEAGKGVLAPKLKISG